MEHDTKAPDSPAVAGLVERTVRPCAWRWGATKLRGVEWRYAARNTRTNAEPLYDQAGMQAATEVGVRLGTVTERERVRALMMEMHERDKHRHNYWRCAVVELFGA